MRVVQNQLLNAAFRNCSISDSRVRQPHCPQTERILKDTTVPVRVTVVLVQGTDAIRNLQSLSPQWRSCRLARKIEEPCRFPRVPFWPTPHLTWSASCAPPIAPSAPTPVPPAHRPRVSVCGCPFPGRLRPRAPARHRPCYAPAPLRLSATPAVSPSGCLAPAGRGSAVRNKSAAALTSISECRSGGASRSGNWSDGDFATAMTYWAWALP